MFLKNKNIIFKIRRSKVTDYAALKVSNTISSESFQSNNVGEIDIPFYLNSDSRLICTTSQKQPDSII